MRIMLRLLTVLLILLQVGLTGVHAQNTNLSVQFPDHATVGSIILVNVTLTYSGASPGQAILVLISEQFTRNTPQGKATSTPDPCMPVSAFVGNSTCSILVVQNSGREILQFALSAPLLAQDWKLLVVAGVMASDPKLKAIKLLPSSPSASSFIIRVTNY